MSFKCHINVDDLSVWIGNVFIVCLSIVWLQVLCSFKIFVTFSLLFICFLNTCKAALYGLLFD